MCACAVSVVVLVPSKWAFRCITRARESKQPESGQCASWPDLHVCVLVLCISWMHSREPSSEGARIIVVELLFVLIR